MRRLGGAAAAAAVLIMLTGCGSQAAAPSASPTVTVVRTPSATPSATPSTSSAEPTATTTVTATPDSTSAPVSQDPDRPANQCADSAIGVSLAPSPDGGGAGSEYYRLVFTNTGGGSCALRGTPGVSVVGSGDGTQLGAPARRNQDGVRTITLAEGGSVESVLQVVNIGDDGGPLENCMVQPGDGYRVYPPHSKKAFFVRDSNAKACKTGPVFMTVGPVKPL